ncbi:MAG: choice-of-anchor L domain-containing protein [Bacteroidales bacterium]|nr:choice-of-anchor L domain-containing protein [Bacteroidales bacterium]
MNKNRMKNTVLVLVVFCMTILSTDKVAAQAITVSNVNGQSPAAFLNTNLAAQDVELYNCKFNWSTGNINGSQVGTFANTNPHFPYSAGIVLTTGNISVAPGPNSSVSESSTLGVNNANGQHDSDLQALISQPLNGTSVLEFNFKSTLGNTFSFHYIFGSEEYPEYVCSSFNDVFGFFLTGPDYFTGQNTTKNIALIPGTTLPVAINTLNGGTPAGEASDCNLSYSNFYNNNSYNGAVEYDGNTVDLTAESMVQQCAEYTIKLSIANASDGAYDSGVFLEKGSFVVPKLKLTHTTEMNNDTLIENCNWSDLYFTISEPLENDLMIHVSELPGTTASAQDYRLLVYRTNGTIDTIGAGAWFSFPAGVTSQHLRCMVAPNAPIPDYQSKTLKLDFSADICTPFTYLDGHTENMIQHDIVEFKLVANHQFTVGNDSIFYCDGCHHVALQLQGGTEPLRYSWTPSAPLANPHARESDANVTQPTTFQVIVSDRWNCLVDTGFHTALITQTPTIEGHYFISPRTICVPEEVEFRSTATPAQFHEWTITGEGGADTTILAQNFTYTFDQPGHYSIYYRAYEAPECEGHINLSNYIIAGETPIPQFVFEPAEPEVGEEVVFTNESVGNNLSYEWSFGDGNTSHEENPTHIYNNENTESYNVVLKATDPAGCSDTYMQPVPVVDNFALWVPNSFTPNKDGLNDIFLPSVNCVAKYDITIYDRKGGMIFYSDNPEVGWDGTFNGKPCPAGVYDYIIHYVRFNNLKQDLLSRGQILLVK